MKAKLVSRTIQSLTPRSVPYDVRDTELSGFLVRVMPSGGMGYYCDFRHSDGRRTRIKLGNVQVLSPMQARSEALKVLGDVARGINPLSMRRAARVDSLETFITQHYGPWAIAHRKTGAKTVKGALSSFSEFRDTQLSEISSWRVEKWRSDRLKCGNMKATVNRNVNMLKAILQKAVEWDLIELNPLARVKPFRIDCAPKVRYLSADEEASLRTALDIREDRVRGERHSHNSWRSVRGYAPFQSIDPDHFVDHLKPMVILSMSTGLRRGEVFNLQWDNVDLTRRMLTIEGTNSKSGKTRHIPLNTDALGVLMRWRDQAGGGQGLVFPGRDGHAFDNVSTSWAALLSLAKISNFRWHDMRHHFASMLVMRGVDLNTVRQLLGHADIKMTLRYAHLAPQIMAEAVSRLERPLAFTSTATTA